MKYFSRKLHRHSILALKLLFWTLIFLVGLYQAWSSRYNFYTGDLVTYLDMGDAYARGDWNAAIHGYFGPLYPWILKLVLSIVNPSMYWKILTIKLVNLLLILINALCFDCLLSSFIAYHRLNKRENPRIEKYYEIPEWLWIVAGYFLFLWTQIEFLGADKDTPDSIVSSTIYIATALVLKAAISSPSIISFILIGIVLGLGYLAKPFMFPFAIVFLVLSFSFLRKKSRLMATGIAALFSFLIVVSPLVAAISYEKGYFTFGENGKLNYAWNIDTGLPARYWLGKEPGWGTPKHIPEQLYDRPAVFDFSGHFEKATLPIGYDPSYWYEGTKIKVKLYKVLSPLWKNIAFYWQQLGALLLFLSAFLFLLKGDFNDFWFGLRKNWLLLALSLIGFLAYAMANDLTSAQHGGNNSMRYVVAFVTFLFAGILSSIYIKDSKELARGIKALVLSLGILLVQLFGLSMKAPRAPILWKVANTLHNAGFKPGDRLAAVNLLRTSDWWARLGDLRVTAEITNSAEFFQLSPEEQAIIYRRLRAKGIKAVIYKARMGDGSPELFAKLGWQNIEGTDFYFFPL